MRASHKGFILVLVETIIASSVCRLAPALLNNRPVAGGFSVIPEEETAFTTVLHVRPTDTLNHENAVLAAEVAE